VQVVLRRPSALREHRERSQVVSQQDARRRRQLRLACEGLRRPAEAKAKALHALLRLLRRRPYALREQRERLQVV
jgi:hypothetical protein